MATAGAQWTEVEVAEDAYSGRLGSLKLCGRPLEVADDAFVIASGFD